MSNHYGEWTGETKETPGMVRWSHDSHYFLKRIGTRAEVTKPDTFVLGLENLYGDGAYIFSCSIEFDNDEAPDLMDRIAKFNALPTYTELLEISLKTNAFLKDLDRMDRAEDLYARRNLRDILKGETDE